MRLKRQGWPWSFWTDTADKIKEGLQQLSDDKFYKLLPSPIVVETARKVKQVVLNVYRLEHINSMSFKWLNDVQDKPRILELYTLTKIHKKVPIGRPIVSGSSRPTECISSFVDSLLQPIAVNQGSYFERHHRFHKFH